MGKRDSPVKAGRNLLQQENTQRIYDKNITPQRETTRSSRSRQNGVKSGQVALMACTLQMHQRITLVVAAPPFHP
ncbi:hypothetical protein EVAR_87755_1 [Eumeta japonica]|uniref:Uncharacterized protein n=1 Tax=Eumeta variegata TaxID=151549 RepID=A0A4C1TGW1_EUMVA|nr:hypothetical protein EVAR_87755_1 [Eumeta japonica]